MSGTPLISVIVPVYKVEAYLDRCVQSIVNQTYTNLEIILVDDGSPDRCPQMCDEWAKKDSRIRVIHKENGGLSDARNAGMAAASGEYISFIDSDDWIEPAFMQILLEAMLAHDCDVAGCLYRKCKESATEDSVSKNCKVQVFERLAAMSELIDNCAIQQVVWNKLYKKTISDGILFEKGKYHEDEFWTYQVIGRINRIAVTDYVGYNYFQRTDSIMGEGYSLNRLDAVEAKVRRQEYLEAYMPELAGKGSVNLAFTCMWHGQLALNDLSETSCKVVFRYLERIIDSRTVIQDKAALKMTHRLWLWMFRMYPKMTCRVRNLLSVGR